VGISRVDLPQQEATRKLAAILSADVVGYSRLMSNDEASTVVTLNTYRGVFRDLITQRQGRVVDTAGDSVLAEFPSVVQAVQCAVDVQRDLAPRNGALPENRRMEFRIGINLGDVIEHRDGSIYGDGINIAARLEALADAGGINVSGTVFDHVEGKLGIGFDGLGEREVKNIAKPVRVYRVRLGGDGPEPEVAAGAAPLALPDKPSIAVLPFTNMSADPEQEYFSDGITEDIITDLSKFSGLFVIARNSSFAYKGRAVDIAQVAGELGVRYVLEGSIRRAGDRVRVNAQLIDGANGGHLWAERYDGDMTDIFEVQDAVTRQIVAALEVKLTAAERDKASCCGGTDNMEAYDWYLRARENIGTTPDTSAQAREMCERAIALDPDFADAHATVAFTYLQDYTNQWTDDPRDSLRLAQAAAERAVTLGPDRAHPNLASAMMNLWHERHDAALADADRAIALDPNFVGGYLAKGSALHYAGKSEQAIEAYNQAMRLNPHFPNIMFQFLGQSHFMLGQFDEAIEAFERRIIRNPCTDSSHVWLAAIYGHQGRIEEARAEWDKALAVNPNYSLDERIKTWPYRNPADRERVVEGLRQAGLA